MCSSHCGFCMAASVLHLPRDLLGRRPSPSSSLFLFTPTPLVMSRTKLTVCHCFVGVRFCSRREELTRPAYSLFRFPSIGVRIRSHSEFFRRGPPPCLQLFVRPPCGQTSCNHLSFGRFLSKLSLGCFLFRGQKHLPRRHWPFALFIFGQGFQPPVLGVCGEGKY